MANHITTVATITGPDEEIGRLLRTHVLPVEREPGEKADGSVFLDFRTVIPKASIVDQTQAGSAATIGLAALVGDVIWTDFTHFAYLPAGVLKGAPYRHAALVREWLAANHPNALVEGRKCAQCIAETGYPNWLEWSCANWGTKWNSYDYTERERIAGRAAVQFVTANGVPRPILRRLSEMYPLLVIEIESIDEGGPEFVGQYSDGAERFKQVEHDRERYKRVYGEYPDAGDDDAEASP